MCVLAVSGLLPDAATAVGVMGLCIQVGAQLSTLQHPCYEHAVTLPWRCSHLRLAAASVLTLSQAGLVQGLVFHVSYAMSVMIAAAAACA